MDGSSLCLTIGFAWLCSLLFMLLDERWTSKKMRRPGVQRPPQFPSAMPLVGHVPLMAWDTPAFIESVISGFKGIPVRLRLVVADFYVVSGHEHIKAVWRAPDTHVHAYKSLSVQNMFKLPSEALKFWISDDSGIGKKPNPGSKTLPHNRIERMTYHTVHKFLTGPGLKPFTERFTSNLLQRLATNSDIREEWIYMDDLFTLVQEQLFAAALHAMCGEYILKLNPTFVKDYWQFHRQIHELAKGYPKWIKPEAYRIRDKCIDSVKKWHEFIKPYLTDPSLDGQIWNPYFGTDVIRARHEGWSKMEKMTIDATASEDLSLIWAANGNSIPAAFWMLAEILRDPKLFSRVRETVEQYRLPQASNELDFNWNDLCDDPLLQSIYAETMRLKVASFLFRSPENDNFLLDRWRIPRNAVMLISGHNAQMDREVWERNGDRPVEEFWSERFLSSGFNAGDELFTQSKKGCNNSDSVNAQLPQVAFSLGDRSGSWLPYGGGKRMCPGRHFNKQEMIVGMTAMITTFDIELLTKDGSLPEPDMRGFGFGTLLPKGKTPARIRRSNPSARSRM